VELPLHLSRRNLIVGPQAGSLNVWNQAFNTGKLWVFGFAFRWDAPFNRRLSARSHRRCRVEMETKWKHRRIDRLGDQRKFLIENGGQGQNRTADTRIFSPRSVVLGTYESITYSTCQPHPQAHPGTITAHQV